MPWFLFIILASDPFISLKYRHNELFMACYFRFSFASLARLQCSCSTPKVKPHSHPEGIVVCFLKVIIQCRTCFASPFLSPSIGYNTRYEYEQYTRVPAPSGGVAWGGTTVKKARSRSESRQCRLHAGRQVTVVSHRALKCHPVRRPPETPGYIYLFKNPFSETLRMNGCSSNGQSCDDQLWISILRRRQVDVCINIGENIGSTFKPCQDLC